MLMGVDARADGTTVSARPLGARANLVATVVAGIVICCWTLVSAGLIQGLGVWLSSPEYGLHLTLNVACMVVCASYAARRHGGLDEKLAQALMAVFVVFGVYALALLIGRLFFSRSMLLSFLAGGILISGLVVVLLHRLAVRRVAIVAPLVGDIRNPDALGQLVHDPQVDLRDFDIILVSLSEHVSAEWCKALSRAMLAGCKVRHIGEYIEELKGTVSVDYFEIDHLPPNGIASYRALKRAMDIGLVIFFLPVALPVLCVSCLLILLTMGQPVLYRQIRIGLGGEPFTILKLRTMRPEQPGERATAAVVGDLRITRLGRVLRRFRIDELPQLWNVLRGDMSLIGPRPEAVPLHEQYIGQVPNYVYRYLVRPGITGWAQVSAPPSVNTDEARYKLTFDLFYVKKLSLYLDLLIVARTFWTIAAGGGAR